MKFFENVLSDEVFVGLASMGIKSAKIHNIYKNKYNPLLFKVDYKLPFKNTMYLIDQILCHP